MYETSSCDKNMTVNAYRIIDSPWTKKNVTWNTKPRYNTSSGIMGSVKTTGTLYKSKSNGSYNICWACKVQYSNKIKVLC